MPNPANPERTVMFQLPTGLAGTLACVAGTVAGRSFELSAGTFHIGRLDNCDLSLPSEPGVSKSHAKIVAEGDHYVIVDCESRNGTMVNGAPVQRARLQDGDEIRVCGCVLRFTQRGATSGGVRVRNIDAPAPPSVEVDVDATGMSVDEADVAAPPTPIGLEPQPTGMSMARPSRSRVLLAWYAYGFIGMLLFGSAASAVIVINAPAPEKVIDSAGKIAEGAPPSDKPAEAAGTADKAGPVDAAKEPPAAAAADAGAAGSAAAAAVAAVADVEKGLVPASTDDAKAKDAAKVEEPAADKREDTASEDAVVADKAEKADKKVRRSTSSRRREDAAAAPASAEAPAETPESTSSDASGKAFAAVVEGGRSETLKTKGGKVKSVEARDGEVVSKGQVLITFEEGASQDEIATLRDRIASLEGVDSDDARRDLAAAKQRLQALTSGAKTAPVVAGMIGKLTGFSVEIGAVLKSNQVVGRIVDGDTPTRVRVNVDRATKPKRGQSVTLVKRGGGEASGSVASVSGRTVVVDTGDVPGDEVESVRF